MEAKQQEHHPLVNIKAYQEAFFNNDDSQGYCDNARTITIARGLKRDLRRTLGVEFEFWGEYASKYDGKDLSARHADILTVPMLLSTRFRELYALHGKAPDGTWKENYVPIEMINALFSNMDRFGFFFGANIIIPPWADPSCCFWSNEDRSSLEVVTTYKLMDWQDWDFLSFLDKSVPTGFRVKAEHYFCFILMMLMEVRGRDREDLFQIRKRQSAWDNFPDKDAQKDAWMPDRIAEHWESATDYAPNLQEFTVNGFLETGPQLQAFLTHLSKRLGIFENTPQAKALHGRLLKSDQDVYKKLSQRVKNLNKYHKQMPGHVHWVPRDIMAHTGEERLLILKALVGYWGDINDAEQIFYTHFTGNTLDPRIIETWRDLLDNPQIISDGLWDALEIKNNLDLKAKWIRPLRRSTYERIRISERGIRIVGRDQDLKKSVDKNIPTDFKYLFCGLRSGPYTEKHYKEDEDNPMIGLEMRSSHYYGAPRDREGKAGGHSNYLENYKRLPKCEPKTDKVNMRSFLAHADGKARGIEDRFRKYMEITGLGGDFFERILYTIRKYLNPQTWSPEEVLCEWMAPLTPWFEHPLVEANLKKCQPLEAQKARIRYEKAFNTYLSTLKSLEQKVLKNEISDRQMLGALFVSPIIFTLDSGLEKLIDMDIEVQEHEVQQESKPSLGAVPLIKAKEKIELEDDEALFKNQALIRRSEAMDTYLKSLQTLQGMVDLDKISNKDLVGLMNEHYQTFLINGGLTQALQKEDN